MTIYIALILLVTIFALIGFVDRNLDTLLFRIEMLLMTVLLCFRYGQGSDYHNYERIFVVQAESPGLAYEGEKLFAIVNKLAGLADWTFPLFLGTIGLICMALTYRGIYKLSEIKTISVLLLLPAYYLTYYFSAIREGIALAVTLGVIIPLLLEHRRVEAFLWIIVLFFIHQSSLIMLAMLIEFPWCKIRKIILTISMACGLGLWVILQFVKINIHELYFSPSYAAVLIRVFVFSLISLMYEKSEKTKRVNRLYNLYLIGFCFYMITFVSALFSQRGTAYYKIIEVILIPCMLGYIVPKSVADCRYAMRKTLCAGMIILSLVEGIKNLASYPAQMEYSDGITFYNYQYISIFNKEQERLYKDGI